VRVSCESAPLCLAIGLQLDGAMRFATLFVGLLCACATDPESRNPDFDPGVVTPEAEELVCGERLTRIAGFVEAMVTDATHLYWVEAPNSDQPISLHRIPKAGDKAETLVEGLAMDALDVILREDATHVYLGDKGQLIRVRKADAEVELITEARAFADFVLDDEHIYWNFDDLRAILSADKSSLEQSVIAPPVRTLGSTLGVDDTHVYYQRERSNIVERFPKANRGDPQPVGAGSDGFVSELLVDGDRVYWSVFDRDTENTATFVADKTRNDDGPATRIANDDPFDGIQLDAGSLYIQNRGELFRYPTTGALDLDGELFLREVQEFAVDDGRVYYFTFGGPAKELRVAPLDTPCL
jgi:hypothetical protein